MERENEESVLPTVMELCFERSSAEAVHHLLIVKVPSSHNAHVYIGQMSIVNLKLRPKNPPAVVIRMMSEIFFESGVCELESLCVKLLKAFLGVYSFHSSFRNNA